MARGRMAAVAAAPVVQPPMTAGKYRVKSGVHCELVEGDETGTQIVTYNTGDIVESKKDLVKFDPEKFELVGPGNIAYEETDEQLIRDLSSDQPVEDEE